MLVFMKLYENSNINYLVVFDMKSLYMTDFWLGGDFVKRRIIGYI